MASRQWALLVCLADWKACKGWAVQRNWFVQSCQSVHCV